MSRLGCRCGGVIRDHTDSLPYKARVLKDAWALPLQNWLETELQSYVEAALQGLSHQWILERSFGDDYAAVGLNHGQVLGDHISSKLLELWRDAYECESCGRLHVETSEDNQFVSYAPDTGVIHGIFSAKTVVKE